jgi:hypothetical protein
MSSATASWPLDDTTATQSYSRVLNPSITPTKNIVINGTFDTNSNWGLASNLSISGGLLHFSSAAAFAAANENNLLTPGKVYQVTYTVLNYVSGNVYAYVGGNLGTTHTANGTYTQNIVAGTVATFQIQTPGGGTFDIDNVTVTQINIPSSGSTPTNLLTDGTMEAAGTASWSIVNAATLTKQSTNPHGGSQVLRIARNGSNSAGARQTSILTAGRVYRLTGYARSDGSAVPTSTDGSVGLFTGTASTAWQPIDTVFVAVGTEIRLTASTAVDGQYVEFDDVTVSLDTSIRPDQVLLDADMEASGTSNWISIYNFATITKQSTNPHGGSQVLRVAIGGASGFPGVSQAVLQTGKTYHVTGYARGDGSALPYMNQGSGAQIWSGTTSTSWQAIDATFVEGISGLGTGVITFNASGTPSSGNYAEFDDISITEVDPLIALPTGGVTLGSASGGHLTNAYTFDASNDLVNIYSTGLNSAFNGDEGTAVVWAKVANSGVWTDGTYRFMVHISVGSGESTNGSIFLRRNNVNGMIEASYAAGGVDKYIYIPTGSPLGWFQFVMTWSKSRDEFKAYFNGVQSGSAITGLGTWVGNLDSTYTVLGMRGTGGSNAWSGLINDVRLYTRALSQDEIADLYSSSSDRQAYYTENYPGKELVRLYNTGVTVAAPATEEVGGGPVAYWKFDEGTGTTTTDSSSNKFVGTLTGMASPPTPTSGWQTEDQCISGKCLSFDGSNDFVTFGNVSALNFERTNSFTLSGWIKVTGSISSAPVIVSKMDNNGKGYALLVSSTGYLQFNITRALGSNFLSVVSTQTNINDKKWHHVAAVYTGTSTTGGTSLYTDGILNNITGSSNLNDSITNTAPVNVSGYNSGQELFPGFIDDVKIYPYARTAAQIKADYTGKGTINGAAAAAGGTLSAVEGLSNGLVAYWKMDETSWNGTASEVIDSSGNGNNGVAGYANGTGTSTGSNSANTLNDTGKNWSTNTLTNFSIYITSGLGSGQTRTISSNTSTQVTVSTNWSVNPDNTSHYRIVPSSVAGQFGNAFSLPGVIDGSGDIANIDVATSTSLQSFGTGGITVAGWLYNNGTPSNHFPPLAQKGSGDFSDNSGKGFSLMASYFSSTNNTIDWVVQPIAASTQDQVSYVPPGGLTGKWMHVVGVADDQAAQNPKLRLYINGQLVATANRSQIGTIDNTDHLTIGAHQIGSSSISGGNYNGKIDEVRIYNRALTPSEVTALYRFAPGPVGYWKLDDATGTSAKDSSGNNNTGTFTGSPSPSWMSGKYGAAVSFPGNSNPSYINIPSSTTLDGFRAMTACSWSYLTRAPSFDSGVLLLKATNASGNTPLDPYSLYALSVSTTKKVNWIISTGVAASRVLVVSNASINLNTWNYICGTYDGTTMKIFINGTQDSATGSTSIVVGANSIPVQIGAYAHTSYPDGWDGLIDDMKIYNYARTPAQIIEDMLGGKPGGSNDSPIGYWKFDEGSGTTAFNSGTGGPTYNGTLSGFASPATATSGWQQTGKIGKDLYFDGSDDKVTIPLISNQTQNISMSIWVNPSTAQWRPIFYNGTGGTNGYGLYIGNGSQGAGNSLELYLQGVTYNALTSHNAVIPNNTWTHIALTRGTSTWKVYVNGVQTDTGTTNPVTPTGNTWITGVGASFIGKLDEAKFYNYELTPDQIKTDYNAGASTTYGTKTASLSNLQDGLVGWWKMDEASWTNDCSTTVTTDSSGNNNNGKACNTSSITSGKYGNAGNFNGGYVDAGAGASLDIEGTSPITISQWVYPKLTGGGAYPRTLEKERYVSYSNRGGFIIQMLNDGTTSCLFDNNTVTGANLTVTSNQWVLVTCTYDGTSIKAYKNDVLISSTAYTGGIGTHPTTHIYIGGSTSQNFNGYVDDTRIYNRALSPTEVQQLYNSGSPGPVATYDFNEGTGTSITDKSGNANTGTWNGTGSHWSPGHSGFGGNFNGTNDYVSVPDPGANSALDFAGGSSITIEAWVNLSSATPRATILAKGSGDVDNYAIRNNGGGQLEFWYRNSGNTAYHEWRSTSSPLIANQWTHLAVTFTYGTGSSIKFYLNGTSVSGLWATGDGSAAPLQDNNSLIIGGLDSAQYITGKIDDVKIYNYARSATEIAADASGKDAQNGGSPVAWYKMDECQGSTIHDNSGNSNDGTLTIGPAGSQTAPGTCATATGAWGNGATGKFNSSLNLDGNDDLVTIPDNSYLDTSGDLTLAAWVKTTSNNPAAGIITKTAADNQHAPYALYVSAGLPSFLLGNSTTALFIQPTNVVVNDDAWHHLVGTVQGTAMTLYVDGKIVGTTTFTGTRVTNTNTLNLGAYAYGTNKISGQLDDVRIYNYALTTEQVKTLFNGGSAIRFGP